MYFVSHLLIIVFDGLMVNLGSRYEPSYIQ